MRLALWRTEDKICDGGGKVKEPCETDAEVCKPPQPPELAKDFQE